MGPDHATHPVYEVLAAAIAKQGVRDVFGLMGAATIRLTMDLVDRHGITVHASRHEAGAVAAADGYARVSGKVGVAAVTWGPAVTNTITSLTTARKGSSALVLLAGDSWGAPVGKSPFAKGAQGIDQELLMAAIDVPTVRIRPQTVGRDVALAFAMARERSGPVALMLPLEYEGVSADPSLPDISSRTEPLPALAEDVAAVAQLLANAERPLILAGRGAVTSGARDALVRLADRTGALLATTLRGMGLFTDHPHDLGICGGFAEAAIQDLIRQSDCVVAFGAGLSSFTTMRGGLFAKASVVHIDDDHSALHQQYRAARGVIGDARLIAEALFEKVPARKGESAYRAAADRVGLSDTTRQHQFEDISQEGALDPRGVCKRLDAAVPHPRTVVVDSGACSGWPPIILKHRDPNALLWMNDFGTVGSGMGTAIGAALAAPDRVTLLFQGDGGLMMTLGELDTAVRTKARVVIACMNDRAYGSELVHMRDWGMPLHDSARFDTPDLAAVARSIGCTAHRITRLDQIDALAADFRNLQGPLFLDCILTQEPMSAPSRKHI
jgi:acetolactate synthase-1/2/3 large subunit